MGPLQIEPGTDADGQRGAWVWFDPDSDPVFVLERQWIGVDFDGTLARDDEAGHFSPPYPLGQPIPQMLAAVKSLIRAGVKVRIFSARACEPESVPAIQDWTERHGLGRLEVTNAKDYDLIRYLDDRAIQVVPNQGRTLLSCCRAECGVPSGG
jgi:hypothetical protein